MMTLLLKLDQCFASLARLCGALACMAMILLLLNVFYDVIMRYAFNDVSIGMQELEWHLFSATFLLGIPYAIHENSHVRVDILYDRWTPKTQALINIIGTLLFILPFIVLVSYYSISFTYDAYQMGEGSGDPGGLPHRWLIKGLIPFSFIMMGLVSLGIITRAILSLKQAPTMQKPQQSSLL